MKDDGIRSLVGMIRVCIIVLLAALMQANGILPKPLRSYPPLSLPQPPPSHHPSSSLATDNWGPYTLWCMEKCIPICAKIIGVVPGREEPMRNCLNEYLRRCKISLNDGAHGCVAGCVESVPSNFPSGSIQALFL